MPAKKKITKEAVIATAMEILRDKGLDGINARTIAEKLRCSTQPIYSEFGNMDGLKDALWVEAEKCYAETVKAYTKSDDYSPYMAYGLGYIRFAKEEKQLFRYLYMCDRHGQGQDIEDINKPSILKVLQEYYDYPEDTARSLHFDIMIYTHGLAVAVNTNYMVFTEREIIRRLRTEYVGLCSAYGVPVITSPPMVQFLAAENSDKDAVQEKGRAL